MDPVIETFHCIAMILLTGFEFEARNSNAQLITVNDCTCQGYNLVYECSVTGGQATVWTEQYLIARTMKLSYSMKY